MKVLQKFYSTLQNAAKGDEEPELHDSTLPNFELINRDAGTLLRALSQKATEDFGHYEEEKVDGKRKMSQTDTSASKKFKASDVDPSNEVEMKEIHKTGKLSKLTVAQLTAFCKVLLVCLKVLMF